MDDHACSVDGLMQVTEPAKISQRKLYSRLRAVAQGNSVADGEDYSLLAYSIGPMLQDIEQPGRLV